MPRIDKERRIASIGTKCQRLASSIKAYLHMYDMGIDGVRYSIHSMETLQENREN